MRSQRSPARERGMSLIEVTLAVVTLGVVLATVMQARMQTTSKIKPGDASAMDAIVAAIHAYAKRNLRLPCADINGDDFEDRVAATGLCESSATTGGVPFKTLGLELTSLQADRGGDRYVYSVFRGEGDVAKDLTVLAERTGVSGGSPPLHDALHASFQNVDDFQQAVLNAWSASATVSTSNPFVTGDGAHSGAVNCTTNRVTNAAFLVAFAGTANADGSGGLFDGVNPASGWTATPPRWAGVQSHVCFSGPATPASLRYDDVVRAVSFSELLGALSQ